MRLKYPRPYRDAIRLYSEAIMWATPASEDLSMAFANRSAAHFDNGNFRASIQDIENAFSLGSYPEKLAYKLHLRRGFSLKELGQEKLALAAFSTAEALLEVAQLDAVKVAEVKEIIEESRVKITERAEQTDRPIFKESEALPCVEPCSESIPELTDGVRVVHQVRLVQSPPLSLVQTPPDTVLSLVGP